MPKQVILPPMSETFQPAHADYLRDESRREGRADRMAFPRTETDVLSCLAEARSLHMPLTTQGARTGVTGGAVPEGGMVLNLSHMNRIHAPENNTLRVQPGATLAAIRAALPAGLYFAPDPTEPSASIGGMISCNSSGALSFLHGPTRNHVLGLRVALPGGEVADLRRGRDTTTNYRFQLGSLSGTLPPIPRPSVKNAAGYFIDPDMDLADLFIGAEGTLGVVVEATLRLLPAPGAIWGLMAFLPSTASVIACVNALRQAPREGPARLAALEYFDSFCLDFLRSRDDILASKGIAVPAIPSGAACVYAEWHAPDDETAEAALMSAAERLPDFGGNIDASILADNPHDMEKLKLFRHAVPEMVNSSIDERRKIHPGLVKLGTDMSVPDARLADVLDLYETDLAASGLEHLTFGHIGANHLHVNILPRNPADYNAGRALYSRWAGQVIRWGGSISAEHGIGKIKRDLFRQMAGDDSLAQMRALKRMFDPDWMLNPGTLLEAP